MSLAKMPHTSRRGFMGFLGALPLSARQIAQQSVANIGVAGPVSSGLTGGEPCVPASGRRMGLLGIDALRRKLDPWKRAEIRREASRVTEFDPDIASMRSVSLVGKVRLQRNRQIERAEGSVWDELFIDEGRMEAFKRMSAE